MPEYAITYENDFPFVLYASTEVSTTARTAAISRSSYQFCTVEFVREGAGFLDINGKSFHIRKNGVYFLTPGSTHTYWPDRSDPPCSKPTKWRRSTTFRTVPSSKSILRR